MTESMASKAKLTNEEVLTLLGLQVGDKLDEREQAIADRALSKIRAAMLPDTKDK